MKEKVFWASEYCHTIELSERKKDVGSGRYLVDPCQDNFERISGIKFKKGEVKKVLITFKEL